MIYPGVYGLDLPLAWRIHLVFHVLNLKRFHRSQEFEREKRSPFRIVVDGEKEYEVEAILNHKRKGAQRLHLVMWKGYPIIEVSWEPESHLQNTPLSITCAASGRRTSIDGRLEETGQRVDGGSEECKAMGEFAAEGPVLVGRLHRWGEISFGVHNPRGWC